MKTIFFAILSVLLLQLPMAAVDDLRAEPMAENAIFLKPIMIIRFNQPRVYFQKPMALMIRQALQAKADVQFDVIQYIPSGANAAAAQAFSKNIQAVSSEFSNNGVASQRVSVSQQSSPDVASDEIYIFVR